MIIYKNTSADFLEDVNKNRIVDLIQDSFQRQIGWYPSQEKAAWTNSMQFMESIVRNAEIEDDCGILIEYKIPLTSKRIDFVIAGMDESDNRNFLIIELKQWESAQATDLDNIVVTLIGKGLRDTPHPSYQAYTYKTLLVDFNENIEKKNLNPYCCAYLHNYKEKDPEPLRYNTYTQILSESPIFFKHDTDKLQKFIREHVGSGSGMEILYDIQYGNIRPSTKLIDHVCSMFKGNQVFTLIDNQKVAFEKALDIALHADSKTVLVIKGGPGTGKSVISVNLLGALLQEKHNAIFVAPNASFRDVMTKKLAQDKETTRIKHLFKGSSSFIDVEPNTFNTIVVDEAHRLKNGSAFQYWGENQLEDIIKAGLTTILFIDDNQRIRPEDIGTVDEINRVAKAAGATLYEIELEAQFRCAGAEGFVNWLDHVLHIQQTANYDGWDSMDFDFRIFDDPNELHKAVSQRRVEGFSSRILAGYAWKWTSESDGNPNGEVEDVVIKEHNFTMPWNSRRSRTTWAIDPTGEEQIGCIHTSQGLEFDYVGVIVGNDLRFDPESLSYHVDWNSYKDSGGKKTLKDKPEQLSILVRNIYKTLMSRAMRGCYVYFCNKDVENHFKNSLPDVITEKAQEDIEIEAKVLHIESNITQELQFKTHLPVYSYAAACGHFGEGEPAEIDSWVKADAIGELRQNMFVVRAHGQSMEPRIPEGSYCVFRSPLVGTRQDKIVLVQHREFHDPECGGAFSIKKYTSKKVYDDEGSWKHEEIVLQPLNKEYESIRISESESQGFTVIGEFITVL